MTGTQSRIGLDSIRSLFPARRKWIALAVCLIALVRRPGAAALAGLPRWWRSLTHRNRHFLFNIFLGVAIELVVHGLHHHHIINTDFSVDWMIRMFRQTELPKAPIPVAWVDIDEETYARWEEPFHVPRDRLAALIEKIIQGHPRALIIDVDLRRKSADVGADEKLKSVLAMAGKGCAGRPGASCPPILLPLPAREMSGTDGLQVRRSFLDTLVGGNHQAQWISVSYERGKDGVVRHWRLWENIDEPTDGVVLSAQLATLCAWNNQELQKATRSLMELAEGQGQKARSSHVCGVKVGNEHEDLSKRIFYATPWYPDERDRAYPTWLTHVSPDIVEGAAEVNALFKGKVVVLGASYGESYDFHATPLGTMPGALVIINSIQSLFQYGEFHSPPFWAELIIVVSLIMLMSMAFALMSSFKAQLLSSVLIILVLLPLSFWLFRSGVWLDFALPLLGVQIHDIWGRIESPGGEHGHA